MWDCADIGSGREGFANGEEFEGTGVEFRCAREEFDCRVPLISIKNQIITHLLDVGQGIFIKTIL